MRLSTHAKSRIMALIDQVTSFGLKVGGSLTAAAFIYLLYVTLGQHMRKLPSMSEAERAYFINSVRIAVQVLSIAGAAVVASLVLRFFNDEAPGQILSLAGATLYFGSPFFLRAAAGESAAKGAELFASVVNVFCWLGMVCLLPGLVLILRDAILRIWSGISVRRIMERRWGDEEERLKRLGRRKFYGSCWDMAFCREFVKQVCPAFSAKKPCWRLKVGCYCDEHTILQAMMKSGVDNDHARGVMQNLGLDKPRHTRASAKLRRARCKKCGIYSEHQRQKYRLLSPMVFPAVGLLFYLLRGEISSWIWIALAKTDKFMNFLAYRAGNAYSFSADDGRILTTLAMTWLILIVISYTLRGLEYLIFDLQV